MKPSIIVINAADYEFLHAQLKYRADLVILLDEEEFRIIKDKYGALATGVLKHLQLYLETWVKKFYAPSVPESTLSLHQNCVSLPSSTS